MSTNQWKPVLVLIDVMDRNFPAVAVVAKLAFSTVLTPMKVRMTLLAFIRGIREIEAGMAVAASHAGMLPAKREAGLRMIESDLARDYRPFRPGMTCLTWSLE